MSCFDKLCSTISAKKTVFARGLFFNLIKAYCTEEVILKHKYVTLGYSKMQMKPTQTLIHYVDEYESFIVWLKPL